MLQVFYLDVTKVDLDFAKHACCKPMFASVFIWMLHMFAMVFKYFQMFSQVFQTFVSSVSSVFFLYVATVASR
jgi:hypothetical protein